MEQNTDYRLSLYRQESLIKQTEDSIIEVVRCSLDEKMYIMRSYQDDRREVYLRLQQMDNPQIVKIHEVLFTDKTVVVEEFVEGTLLRYLLHKNAFSVPEAKAMAVQLLQAVEALHKQEIIHRDIKPDNIMLGQDGVLRLIDFGIARIYRKDTPKDTQHLGTIGYAPPEQFGFSQSDFRTDVYAVGVCMKELCMAAKGTGGAPLRKVAEKCCQFDPNQRYASAALALQDLRWRGATRWIKAGGVAVCALALGLGGWAVASNVGKEAPISPQPVSSVAEKGEEQSKSQQPASQPLAESSSLEDASTDLTYGVFDMPWYPIVVSYSKEDITFLPMAQENASGEDFYQLSDDLPEMKLTYTLRDDDLELVLQDSEKPPQTFTFVMNKDPRPDYEGTAIEAELLFYDMDGDGQNEILVAMSDRIRLSTVNGFPLTLVNTQSFFCVGYAENEGFWQAEGVFEIAGMSGRARLDFFGTRELSTSIDWGEARLVGRALQYRE